MNKIQSKSYTTKERLYLKPTELGRIIAAMLEDHFKMVMDIDFTANMENDLDEIAEGHKEWKHFLEDFLGEIFPRH